MCHCSKRLAIIWQRWMRCRHYAIGVTAPRANVWSVAEMQIAYRASHIIDAHLAKHALEDAGITAFVFGESLLGGAGGLPAFGLLQVCVADLQLSQAQAVLAEIGLCGQITRALER
ncbi:DUF2007 domain-containing protein [Xanthomonas oryzae pv. oryzicola]|nr:DUF2007 domain-containing protein [Xanthomonas oryzae pv. oryzicola]